jgi:hypothetical protein
MKHVIVRREYELIMAREAKCATDLPQGELESLMWSQGISEASVAVQYSVI